MSNWKEYTLEELCDFQNGFAFKNSDYVDSSENTNEVFRMGYINRGGGFKEDTTPVFVPQNYPKNLDKFILKLNDITIAMTDMKNSMALLGYCARISHNNRFVLNQRVGRIRVVRNDILDPIYLYYYLNSSKQIDYLRANANSGVQVNLSTDTIKKSILKVPNIEKQREIANILFTLDQKIDLNTQINQTLEQIAQALFKSWFVDFDPVRAKAQALSDGLSLEQAELTAMQTISGKTPEELTALSQTQPDRYAELAETAKAFPCEMVEIDGVEVPKGWEYKSVGDFINVVDYVANGSFATLKENVTLLTEPDYAIYIRTTDFNSGFSKELRYVDKSAYDFLAKSVLIGNEVIISNVGDVGTVFRSPSWLGMPMTLGSNAIALKNYDIPHYLYLYFSSHKGQNDISSIVTGSAQLKFNKTNFRSLNVLMPNNTLLTKFEKFVLPIFEKIDINMAENLKLAEIRDLLLPRLLSGKMIDA